MSKTLRGGTFNVEFGRDHKIVAEEVTTFLTKHDLDFACLQEATEYFEVFKQIPGYDYIASKDSWGAQESTILVKSSLKQDKIRSVNYGDGWYMGKQHHPATGQNQVRIDGWLLVRSLHVPSHSTWTNGKLTTQPVERRDDLVATAKGLVNYFRWPCLTTARLAAGDWNENPSTKGEYSPNWIAQKSRARTITPSSAVGHGHIDWPMFKGCNIEAIYKDLKIREGSDHEPVVFVVKR